MGKIRSVRETHVACGRGRVAGEPACMEGYYLAAAG